jgi:hypothetical protein
MGMHRNIDLGTLVIANGGTSSSSMSFRKWRSGVSKVMIVSPDTLTGTVKVEVSEDNSAWKDLQSNGADITIPADSAVPITVQPWKYLRVTSGSAEGEERTFIVKGEEGH